MCVCAAAAMAIFGAGRVDALVASHLGLTDLNSLMGVNYGVVSLAMDNMRVNFLRAEQVRIMDSALQERRAMTGLVRRHRQAWILTRPGGLNSMTPSALFGTCLTNDIVLQMCDLPTLCSITILTTGMLDHRLETLRIAQAQAERRAILAQAIQHRTTALTLEARVRYIDQLVWALL